MRGIYSLMRAAAFTLNGRVEAALMISSVVCTTERSLNTYRAILPAQASGDDAAVYREPADEVLDNQKALTRCAAHFATTGAHVGSFYHEEPHARNGGGSGICLRSRGIVSPMPRSENQLSAYQRTPFNSSDALWCAHAADGR